MLWCTFRPLYLILVLCAIITDCADEDFYEMFGISKDATNREIRKAFKKLAITMHPDKNPDDKEADSKFIKITQAYEILKDPETRKQYDLYGFESIKSNGRQTNYQSWSYYQNQFGIYDDDPEIITLNQADFDNSVSKSDSRWLINFYSPMCSHCHHVAPAWRRLARALRGVVRVGAVNCDEDWALCRQEHVRSYPTIVFYPSRERFAGERDEDAMTDFALDRVPVSVARLSRHSWDPDRHWVVFLCEDRCYKDNERVKVAAILDGLVEVAEVSCDSEAELCETLLPEAARLPAVVYWVPDMGGAGPRATALEEGDAQHLADQVLTELPDAPLLSSEDFEDMVTRLRLGATTPWLIHFDIGATMQEDLEWRRLPVLTPGIRVGRVHCGRSADLCSRLHVRKYPTFFVLKRGGGYEVHHGRTSAYDVADFARDSARAPNVRSLTPEDFPDVLQDSRSAWVVDFYAPWCPPCLRLLPELRSASRAVGAGVSFGLIDCTVHTGLCRAQEVSSYPTTVLYNNTRAKQRYHGDNSAQGITEFIQDMINPVVVQLTKDNFYTTVGKKPKEELWFVDYYAPWCGPCQQLAPEWRKLAKMMVSFQQIHVGSVDCVSEQQLCSDQGVRSYPMIRLYPLGTFGLSSVALYNGFQRDANALRKWLFNFLPSSVEELTPDTFLSEVIDGRSNWLVDFYAPWCGHCIVFEPEFATIAERLEGIVKCGKLNCDKYRPLCQKAGVYGYPSVALYHGAQRSYAGMDIPSQAGDEIVDRVKATLTGHPGSATLIHDEF